GAESVKSSPPIPKNEANLIVRKYLKSNPNATARDIAENCAIALGRVSRMPAGQVHLAQKQTSLTSTGAKASRQLTKRMLESIGNEDDPSAPMETEEAAWRYLEENAKTPEEESRLNAMTKEKKAEAIRLVMEHFADQEEQEKRRRP